jgi:tryptophanyl-tRNA synthetase
MSKSYNNTIPIFAPEKEIQKQVMRIVTDSKRPEDPKDPQGNTLFTLLSFFAAPERLEEIRQLYLHGGAAYGELKKELAGLILAHFAKARERYFALMNDRAYIDDVLVQGALKARRMGQPYLAAARKATGID